MLQLLLQDGNFLNTYISQGSVATYLRCGGIFKYDFVANLPASLPVKNFENRLTFAEVMGKSLVSCFFETQCILPGKSMMMMSWESGGGAKCYTPLNQLNLLLLQ